MFQELFRLSFFFFFLLVSLGIYFFVPFSIDSSTAYAEDDEYEERYNDDERPVPKTLNTVVYQPVTKNITTTPEEYKRDTDGDNLVDALDPNPTVNQREYFTDSDGDGIPNVFDKHQGEDDFTFYEQETDDNQNGIIDSYENRS